MILDRDISQLELGTTVVHSETTAHLASLGPSSLPLGFAMQFFDH